MLESVYNIELDGCRRLSDDQTMLHFVGPCARYEQKKDDNANNNKYSMAHSTSHKCWAADNNGICGDAHSATLDSMT